MTCRGHPAIVIDTPISKHLAVLSTMRLLGLGIVKRVKHRCPIERSLRCPVHALWERQAGRFQDRRRNIRHVSKLGADFSLSFDARGPMDNDTVGGAAIMGRYLLGPLERSVAGPGPANGIVGERGR